MRLIAIIFLIGCISYESWAQLKVNNLMEYQFGNIPETDPYDLSTLYNQTNVFYRQKEISAFLRVEQFYNSDSSANYLLLSQYRLKYDNAKLKITVGNFYETLGRGLLLRTYEVKGGILEDRIYREKKSFYKDMEGASVALNHEWFELKGIYGKVLNNLTSVEDDNRRPDLVEAVAPGVNFLNQKLALAVMRVHSSGNKSMFSSISVDGSLPFGLNYYGEYASALKTDSIGKIQGIDYGIHGAYVGLSYNYGAFAASFELKDYQNLIIGTGINVPPTLIKEHTYRLLNRSTHLTDLTNERGYQLEVYYTFNSMDVLTLNHSLARNDLYGATYFFREYFVEYALNRFSQFKLKTFFDFSIDEFTLENERYATGLYVDVPFARQRLIGIESEFQQINRNIFQAQQLYNFYNGLRIKPGDKLMLAAIWEFTTDPAVADKVSTTETESRRHFLALQGQYRLLDNHTLQLFVGERRGGPACTGGICYEVLDFKGVEFRLTSKF